MSQPPQTLDELGESLDLWNKLDTGKPETEAKFSPLYDQFNILGKYEVPISEEVSSIHDHSIYGFWRKVSIRNTFFEAK